MKKRILLLGALVGAFLLVSCSGGNKMNYAPLYAMSAVWNWPSKIYALPTFIAGKIDVYKRQD